MQICKHIHVILASQRSLVSLARWHLNRFVIFSSINFTVTTIITAHHDVSNLISKLGTMLSSFNIRHDWSKNLLGLIE